MDTSLPEPRPSRWRKSRRIAIRSVLALLAIYAGISIFAAHILTRPVNRPTTFNHSPTAKWIVPWTTTTADGLTLRGWYCSTPTPRRLIVLVHGMGGTLDEMSDIGLGLHSAGFDVLLFDLRGHGTSDPSRLTMGATERRDLQAVLAWANRQGFSQDRIGWLGWSMGASTVLMEGAENPKLQAAVVDSPFGNLPELLDSQLTEHSNLPAWFNPGILLAARYVFGVRTDNLLPVLSARKWAGRPVLLIHGEVDSIVPVKQARQIAGALGPGSESLILPGVDHVGAFKEAPDRYLTTVGNFFDRNLAH